LFHEPPAFSNPDFDFLPGRNSGTSQKERQMDSFDISRVHWEHGKFSPWYLSGDAHLLNDLRLGSAEELIVIVLDGQEFGFLKRELIYHHIIQGKLNRADFVLTFCGVCNAGALFDPKIEGLSHRYREIGIYNGQQIFQDEETKSLWNHITGECLYGDLKGKRLDLINTPRMTTYGAEVKANPDLPLFVSGKAKVFRAIMNFVIKVILGSPNRNWLPPHFEKTLPEIDDRLPKMTMGLAVRPTKNGQVLFFPISLLKNKSMLTIGKEDFSLSFDGGVPTLKSIDGEMPFQLFTRWYAFSLTYPAGKLISEF
jgi:hypothetical protein